MICVGEVDVVEVVEVEVLVEVDELEEEELEEDDVLVELELDEDEVLVVVVLDEELELLEELVVVVGSGYVGGGYI